VSPLTSTPGIGIPGPDPAAPLIFATAESLSDEFSDGAVQPAPPSPILEDDASIIDNDDGIPYDDFIFYNGHARVVRFLHKRFYGLSSKY
jgi:hypothetical protein